MLTSANRNTYDESFPFNKAAGWHVVHVVHRLLSDLWPIWYDYITFSMQLHYLKESHKTQFNAPSLSISIKAFKQLFYYPHLFKVYIWLWTYIMSSTFIMQSGSSVSKQANCIIMLSLSIQQVCIYELLRNLSRLVLY